MAWKLVRIRLEMHCGMNILKIIMLTARWNVFLSDREKYGWPLFIVQSYLWHLMHGHEEVNNNKLIYIYPFPWRDSFPSLLLCKERQHFSISTHTAVLKTSLMLSYVFGFILNQTCLLLINPAWNLLMYKVITTM